MDRNCTFCRIIAGELPGAFVYTDERVVAFLDINQAAAGHTLIVPRVHAPFWWDLADDDACAIALAVRPILLALQKVLEPPGIRLEQRNGRAAGQEIFHAHLHLIPMGVSSESQHPDRTSLDTRASRIRAALKNVERTGIC